MIPADATCHSCGAARLHELPAFERLPRVTSDSKPFRPGGRLFVCEMCGLVQKLADAKWLEEIGEIYRDYEMYHHSGRADQPVFDAVSGRAMGRCEVLAGRLAQSARLPRSGKLLDFGPGAGAMLAGFSAAFSKWRLFGLDLDTRREDSLRRIPHFEKLFTGRPEALEGRFDLITLVHVLEHLADPLATLKALRARLTPAGRLFVEVLDVERTPFDLVVADHLCHFSAGSLAALLVRAGFAVDLLEKQWINKELSLLTNGQSSAATATDPDPGTALALVQSQLAWLERVLEHARRASADARFGVFGTSIAATWLASGLDRRVQFFVDEDPDRQGRLHLGRPVLSPAQLPSDAVVYLAFPTAVAQAIRSRLGRLSARFAVPD